MLLKSTISPFYAAIAFCRAGVARSWTRYPDQVLVMQRNRQVSRLQLTTQSTEPNDPPIQQPIVGYHQDEFKDWVAELQCGHFQHVRHNPPMTERPWVLTEEGRDSFLGYPLVCKKCKEGAPRDDGK